MIGPGTAAAEGQVLLDHTGAQRHRRQRDLGSQGVVGKAHRDIKNLRHRGHCAQIRVRRMGGIIADAVQENEGLRSRLAQGIHRQLHLVQGGHPGGQDDRLVEACDVLKQPGVGQFTGRDFERRNVQSRKHVSTVFVEGGGKKQDPSFPAVGGKVPVLTLAQFQPPQHVPLGFGGICPFQLIGSLGGAGGRQVLRLEGLELDRIRAGGDRSVDQASGRAQIAVVVDSRLCDDETGVARSHRTLADSDAGCHGRSVPSIRGPHR